MLGKLCPTIFLINFEVQIAADFSIKTLKFDTPNHWNFLNLVCQPLKSFKRGYKTTCRYLFIFTMTFGTEKNNWKISCTPLPLCKFKKGPPCTTTEPCFKESMYFSKPVPPLINYALIVFSKTGQFITNFLKATLTDVLQLL